MLSVYGKRLLGLRDLLCYNNRKTCNQVTISSHLYFCLLVISNEDAYFSSNKPKSCQHDVQEL